MTHFVKSFQCPSCGYNNDCHTNTQGNHKPQPGDISVCLSCIQPMVVQADMSTKPLTPEEELALDPELMGTLHNVQSAMRQLHRENPELAERTKKRRGT